MRLLVALIAPLVSAPGQAPSDPELRIQWPRGVTRPWLGSAWFANRCQDWRLHDGRAECLAHGPTQPMRVAHLLTAEVSDALGDLHVELEVAPVEARADAPAPDDAHAFAGLLLGIGNSRIDYRLSALVHHRPAPEGGVIVAVDGRGHVTLRDFETASGGSNGWSIAGPLQPQDLRELPCQRQGDGLGATPFAALRLQVDARHDGGDHFELHAQARLGDHTLSAVRARLPLRLLDGQLALCSHGGLRGATTGFAFGALSLRGSRLALHPDRALGPILATMYTLAGDRLKLTAQLAPLGGDDATQAALELQRDGRWQRVAQATRRDPGNVCTFAVDHASALGLGQQDVAYRVSCAARDGNDTAGEHLYAGTIRRIPTAERPFVLAAFTGNKHFTGTLRWDHDGIWFPHQDLVAQVRALDPDLLFFSGDQIYEGDLTPAQRAPAAAAELDYQDKWARFCWAFQDLTRDRPTVCIPDDHDVYHGNLWGAGGRAAQAQDDGGYTMPARFVNMVEATQTSHLPDPVDPAPVEQGIGVYFTQLDYAGVSFAVLEDRKFKSSPTVAVPDGQCKNGWFQNPDFDAARQADVPGAELLGARQLAFLQRWAHDWRGGTWVKVALSQTIFANVATAPSRARTDASLPRLPIPAPGEYPGGEQPAADADSNGWPQSGRNAALRALRGGFAIHVAGDQHLASLIRYGIDAPADAGFALCVPSIANAWPRRWFPPTPGTDWREGEPRYTGHYRDGFGNHMQVLAVANPVRTGRLPAELHDRVPGFGIVRLDRAAQRITFECWPRGVAPGAAQYPGWPRTVDLAENFAPAQKVWLPTLRIEGHDQPVVQVSDAATGAPIATRRVRGPTYRPFVLRDGAYRVGVGEPGTARWVTLDEVRPGDGEALVRLQ